MSVSDIIATHYDRLAPEYDKRWVAYIQAQISWVLEQWPISIQEGLALDLGCGTGAMLEAAVQRHPALRLAGVDLSSSMLAQTALRVPQARLLQGDIEDPEFSAMLPKAEVIFSLSILHHLTDIDGHLMLLHDLVKPDGVIFLADFAVDGFAMRVAERYFQIRYPYHRRALSHRDLKTRIDRLFPAKRTQFALLRPDPFWRIQIYRCSKSIPK